MSYSHENENDKDEFEVINRDEYPFDLSLDSEDKLLKSRGHNGGAGAGGNTAGISGNTGDVGAGVGNNSNDLIEPMGLTPILSSLEDPNIDTIDANGGGNGNNFENQLVAQPKLYSNLPPLQPLTEPVIPNGLNFQSYNYDNEYSNNGMVGTNANGTGLRGNLGNSNNSQQIKKRKDSSGPKARPAFVMKVWSMVNDSKNHEYIRWDDDGKTFQVYHREEFMKSILPKYFKHNNFASFVRQLNMYGWHKVQDINTGTLKDDKSIEENWKFKNPYFQRDREDLLDNIVRNKPLNQDDLTEKSPNLKLILGELESIKLNQLAITEDLRRIRKDNKTLWQENFITRERHSKQAQTLDKILKFLATIYGNNNTGKILEVEDDETHQNLVNQLTTNQNGYSAVSPGTGSGSSSGNNFNTDPFNELNFEELTNSPKNYQKPRLMLMNQAYKSNKTTPNSDSAIELKSPESDYKNTKDIETSPQFGEDELINGLEQNIFKQGQSIQQVQDWIQKLSNQQQIQQQQLLEQQEYNQQLQAENRQLNSISSSSGSGLKTPNSKANGTPNANPNSLSPKFDLDFDVNDFLHHNSSANTPVPAEDEQPKRKRFKTENIEELDDEE